MKNRMVMDFELDATFLGNKLKNSSKNFLTK